MGRFSLSLRILGLALLAFAGGILTWIAGHRGIFLLDQCMVFDGGWRVLSGEIPYRDFGAPFGPFTFWFQALFFALLGINWSATVAPAVLLNLLIVPLAWHTYWRLFRGRAELTPWIFAAFSAVLLYPPFGTLWFEVNGLFFVLLSMFFLVQTNEQGQSRASFDVAAGCFSFVAFLCKQNVFLFYFPLLVAVLIATRSQWLQRRRSFLVFTLANLGAFALFLFWSVTFGALDQTIFYLFDLPRQIALNRTRPGQLPFGFSLLDSILVAITLSLNSLLALWLWLRRKTNSDFRFLPIVSVVMLASFLLITATTANEPFVLAFGLAMIFCLQFGIVELIAEEPGPLWPTAIPQSILPQLCKIGITLLALCVVALSIPLILARPTQNFIQGTIFDQQMKAPGLESVFWGNPTMLTSHSDKKPIPLQQTDLEKLIHYLSITDGNFYVWGDSTMLYGLLKKPSASPLLYLGINHSYLLKDSGKLDQMMLDRFRRLKIRRVVRERASFIVGGGNQLQHFPNTYQWVLDNFVSAKTFGIYEVLELRADSPSASQ